VEVRDLRPAIALVDAAIRRRFAFLSLHPQKDHLRDVLRRWLARAGLPTGAADLPDELNRRIPDRDFMIGPSYLMNPAPGPMPAWRGSALVPPGDANA